MDDMTNTPNGEGPITKADVRPGDILLLQYEPLPDKKIRGLIYEAIKDWVSGKPFDEEEVKKLMPLVHWAITVVDNNKFYHAAIVGADRNVIESGLSGVTSTPLADYWDIPISVYRYHDGAIDIGSASLPTAPVTDKAHSLLGQPIKYGYYHAVLLTLWCLFRRGEGAVMAEVRNILEARFGKWWTDILLAGGREEKIRLMLVNLYVHLLDLWRRDHYLVCSELVAVCFNEAEGDTYHISRKTEEAVAAAPAESPELADPADDSDALQQLTDLIDSVSIAAPLQSLEVATQAADTDVLYTPGDLALSVSTRLVGDLGQRKE